MLKLDFSKYTEEFKEEFFKYIVEKRKLREKLEILRGIKSENASLVNLINAILEESTLRDLIIGDYETLVRLRWRMRQYRSVIDTFMGDFKRIFIEEGYDYLKNTIKPKKMVNLLSIKTCPYCNINFIYGDGRKNYGVELDHVMPKSRYPIFAVSLANLIPCCGVCNKTKSNREKVGFKSPFRINIFNDFKFTFIPDIEIKALTEIKLEDIEKKHKRNRLYKKDKSKQRTFFFKREIPKT